MAIGSRFFFGFRLICAAAYKIGDIMRRRIIANKNYAHKFAIMYLLYLTIKYYVNMNCNETFFMQSFILLFITQNNTIQREKVMKN